MLASIFLTFYSLAWIKLLSLEFMIDFKVCCFVVTIEELPFF